MRRILLLLCALFVCGAAHAQFDTRVRDFVQDGLRKDVPFYGIGDYTRFAPSVMHVSLGVLGVPSKHALVDRLIEESIAHACGLSAGYLLKFAVSRPRPDGSDKRSFPSGHTIIAFTGAELTRMDYGWGWGSGAYAFALYTGFDRIWGDRHWCTDVLAGACIGILAAHAGAWLLQPVKDLLGIPDIRWDGLGSRTQVAFAPHIDPFGGSYAATLAVAF